MSLRLEKIRIELEKSRKKVKEYERRVKELEEKYREEENAMIHDMVHTANISVDQLREILQKASEGKLNEYPTGAKFEGGEHNEM